MMSQWWSIIAWSLTSVGVGLALTAGCGGDKDSGLDPINYEDPDASDANADRRPLDVSCEPVARLRECEVDVYVDNVHSCYDGHQVCLGEEGWTRCMSTEDAEAIAEELESADGAGGSAGSGS